MLPPEYRLRFPYSQATRPARSNPLRGNCDWSFNKHSMRILSILFASAFLLVLLLGVAHAAPYQLTTPFAGFQKGATPGIGEYISNFYVYALSIVGVVALGTIIFWGVVYTLSAGMVTKKQDAIDGITQAVYGLLLLLGAYLILYTINPALVTLREPGVEKLLVAPSIGGPTQEPQAPAPQTPQSFTPLGGGGGEAV